MNFYTGCSEDYECEMDEICDAENCRCAKKTCLVQNPIGGKILANSSQVGSEAILDCQPGFIYK